VRRTFGKPHSGWFVVPSGNWIAINAVNNPEWNKKMKPTKTKRSLIINCINRSPLRRGVFLIALTCFVLTPTVRAVDPPPDGGYRNQNTAEGDGALFSLTTGVNNTANGFQALVSNTRGSNNTANGFQALYSNTRGYNNTATGYQALFSNRNFGYWNTANGSQALFSNTTGNNNTANGSQALYRNTTGHENTATGVAALYVNTTGNYNTATGYQALEVNNGHENTANGYQALLNNTTGDQNTANGWQALYFNTSGTNNMASGSGALFHNTTGNSNTASGAGALFNNNAPGNTATGANALSSNTTGRNNTATGAQALNNNTTGSFNIAVGSGAGANLSTGNDNIDIGHPGVAGESNTMRLGNGKQTTTYITGIRGVTTTNADAVPVVIDSAGQLGTVSSSARFKDHIAPMGETSEAVLELKPVTFNYKTDKQNAPQFGLIAEEVAKVNPNLVVRDENGQIYTVRYEAVNAMLLNEFLKEHRNVAEQQSTISELKATVAKQQDAFASKFAQQQRQIEALSAGLQKVSAAIELNKSAPTQVADNR
jgi:trimeric autotransporter adhesin